MTCAEKIIRRALAEGKDPFNELAAELYAIPVAGVTKMQRQLAKASAYQFLFSAAPVPSDLKEIFRRG